MLIFKAMSKDANAVKLQTAVQPASLEFLRIESVRRGMTMGQVIDEWVQSRSAAISESTS
ncbi:hypothetical protein [Microcoleus sp. BROC3]|uniref:hypothetical protein n=1 Tax=Microcoleus sp. BROC3 TaxID=3055323 RepID=UPI002FD32C6D